MQTFWQDLRYGWRTLRQRPGFTLIALLSLALGIGANTAIFSLVKAVILNPLPYPESHRLLALDESNPAQSQDHFGVSWPNFIEWRDQSTSFAQIAASRSSAVIFTGGEEPVRLPSEQMTAEMFALLRVAPALGRTFSAAEDQPGAAPVAVISHGAWVRRFGGDPKIIGREVRFDGRTLTIIGVMPVGFAFPSAETEVWMPLGPLSDSMRNRAVHTLGVIARLKDGVTIEGARAEMATIAARVERAHPAEDPGHLTAVEPLRDLIVGDARPALLILLGAVGLVLLVACANVAGLLLARAVARRKEIALRAAFGANRWRITRQLLTESLLLSLMGGALGLIASLWGVSLLVNAFRDLLPRVGEVSVDTGVIVFTLCLSILTGLIFGLIPAIRASRIDLNETLKDYGGRFGSSPGRQRIRRVIVVTEIALALMLLAGAGLLIKSFWRLTSVDPGFQTENLLTLTLTPLNPKYRDRELLISLYDQVATQLAALPGVSAASASSRLPLSGGDGNGQLSIEGREFQAGEAAAASFRRVLPNYFQTIGAPLRSGREFTAQDRGQGEFVVIINESMARRFWPHGEALGKRIKVGPPEGEPWLTVVGVVSDVKNVGLEAGPMLATYEPYAQRLRVTMNIVVRTINDPLALVSAVRERIRAIDRSVLIDNISTIEQRLSASVAARRLNTMLIGIFAATAILLSAIGIYGLLTFEVAARRHEIGVRMALGAKPGDVLRMVVGEGMRMVGLGIGIGLAAALALARLISGLLFGVSAYDPLTYLAISLLLAAVAFVSCYAPARRATRVAPVIALREE
jgi:putative ABC transport system permease protein